MWKITILALLLAFFCLAFNRFRLMRIAEKLELDVEEKLEELANSEHNKRLMKLYCRIFDRINDRFDDIEFSMLFRVKEIKEVIAEYRILLNYINETSTPVPSGKLGEKGTVIDMSA